MKKNIFHKSQETVKRQYKYQNIFQKLLERSKKKKLLVHLHIQIQISKILYLSQWEIADTWYSVQLVL